MKGFSWFSTISDMVSEKTEMSQAIARFILMGILSTYYMIIGHHEDLTQFGVGYFIMSSIWLVWIKMVPEVSCRKYASLVFDLSAVMLALCLSGPEHLGLFLLFCWIIIGYGYRYGVRFVKYGSILAFVMIASTLAFAPDWSHDGAPLSLEILFIFTLVAAFKYRLLYKLETEIEQRMMYQKKAAQFESRVKKDNLTKLCNREFAIEWLTLKAKTNSRVGVMFLDLDKFKNFNDNYGHHVGDHVLINISKRLVNSVRSDDIVCRYAGDEFIILINDEDVDTINYVAQRITDALNQSVQIETGERLTVTGSIGIAVLGMHGHTPAEILRNADAAMYQAKRLGRNRVAWFEEKIKG